MYLLQRLMYADELVDFFGVDAVRYFVLHEMPFDNDGVISWELLVERINSDLANTPLSQAGLFSPLPLQEPMASSRQCTYYSV